MRIEGSMIGIELVFGYGLGGFGRLWRSRFGKYWRKNLE